MGSICGVVFVFNGFFSLCSGSDQDQTGELFSAHAHEFGDDG
jgi:hypothetical protein